MEVGAVFTHLALPCLCSCCAAFPNDSYSAKLLERRKVHLNQGVHVLDVLYQDHFLYLRIAHLINHGDAR